MADSKNIPPWLYFILLYFWLDKCYILSSTVQSSPNVARESLIYFAVRYYFLQFTVHPPLTDQLFHIVGYTVIQWLRYKIKPSCCDFSRPGRVSDKHEPLAEYWLLNLDYSA